MRINYNVTGADRKALVRAMVELLGEPAVYQGAPSFAYAVGGYQVSKDGMVSFPEDTTPKDIRKLVDALREKGFQPVEPAELPTAAADTGESDPAQADDEDLRFLIIKVPRDGFTPEAEENLRKIIASKAPLLKKALETDSLDLVFTGNAIRFQWFTLHGIDGEADAYHIKRRSRKNTQQRTAFPHMQYYDCRHCDQFRNSKWISRYRNVPEAIYHQHTDHSKGQHLTQIFHPRRHPAGKNQKREKACQSSERRHNQH